MLNLPGQNRQLYLTKLRSMSLRGLKESEPGYLFRCSVLIQIPAENSSMTSCIDIAFRSRLPLPEADRVRRMTMPMWNRRMIQLSGPGLGTEDSILKPRLTY